MRKSSVSTVAYVTDRKRTEDALRQSEERYRSLFDRMLDGVYLSTHEGRFLDVNLAFVKMFGYSSKQEMLVIPDIKKELYFSPEERGSHILDTGKDEVEVYRMRRKDGSEIWVEDHGRYVHDEQGNIIYHEGILRDVTGRRRLEEELQRYSKQLETLVKERSKKLQESEERYRSIVQNIPQKIFIKNRNSVYVSCNDHYANDLNIQPDEISGKTDYDFYRKDLADHYRALDKRVIESGKTEEVEEKYVVQGHEFFVDTIKTPIRDSEGNVTGLLGIFWDITQRKAMEEKLRESEARYRRLFESSPISLWEEDFSGVKKYLDELRARGINDLNRYFREHPEDLAKCARTVKILNVNETTLKLYGAKTVEELRGELRKVLTRESNDQFREELVALGQGKTRFACEFSNQTLTGDTKHVDLILNVIPGYESTLGKVLVSIIDLTELMNMQERLRSAKERLEYVIESNPAVIYIAKPFADFSDFYATYKSKNVISITGFGPEELLGEKGSTFWASRVHPDDLIRYRAGMEKFWKEGHRTCEYRFLHKNGTCRWIREAANVIRDSKGKVLDIIGYWTDVTNLKEMEEELTQSRDQLEQLLATNPAVIYFEEPLPDFSDTYSTYVSESARFVLGFEPKKFLGESGLNFWRSRLHPDDLVRYFAELPLLWREGHHTFEYRFLHGNGTYRWLTEQYRVIHDAKGDVSNVVCVAIDVTERKQLEEKLAKAERLAIIGETAAMVGHDLRNPLQGIATAASLLRNNSLSPNERNEMHKIIDKCVAYSNGIVQDLLDYAQTFQLTLDESTPKRLIASALEAIQVPDKIEVHDQSQEQLVITVDSGRMKRVLINLIENAIDAMPQGGTLTTSSKQAANDNVEIFVSDTGSGMPENAMDNLWKPLQTTKAKGLGLGLAICKRIVDAHGGKVFVKSKIGQGTTVTIRLPMKPLEVKPK